MARDQPRTVLAGNADGMGLVDDQHGVVRLGDRGQLDERCGVAEHGVDGLDEDEGTRLGAVAQGLLDCGEVVVTRDHQRTGLGQPTGIDQGRVHMGVADDQRVRVGEGGDDPEVGVVARGEGEGGGMSGERREGRLELGVQLEGAGDEPRCAGAGSPLPRRGRRGLDHARVAAEPEVVVAGQVDDVGGRRAGSEVTLEAAFLARLPPGVEPVVEAHRTAAAASRPSQIVWRSSSPTT